MPLDRAPAKRITKPRRGPLFYLLALGLPVTAAAVASGWGISEAVRSRRAWLDRAGATVATVKLRYADLRERHPDFAPGAPDAGLAAFFAKPLPRQARAIEEAATLLARARDRYAELAGVSAGADRRHKTFSPNGFRAFYDALALEDTLPPVTGVPILGNAVADARITAMAVSRGYRPRPTADEELLLAEAHYRMFGAPLASYHALRDAAAERGFRLGIVSAYRSIDTQRWSFVNRIGELAMELRGRAVSADEIASGAADDVVEAVLTKNAIPGYSKHHTGSTMDINDEASGRVFTDFGETDAFRWIAADNYAVAKRYGFIPSYPLGATSQGPDPEPWEYVWVGEALLREEW